MHAIELELIVGCVLAISRCLGRYFEAMTRRSAMRHVARLADNQSAFTAEERIRLGALIKDIARPDLRPHTDRIEPSPDRDARGSGPA